MFEHHIIQFFIHVIMLLGLQILIFVLCNLKYYQQMDCARVNIITDPQQGIEAIKVN